MAHVYIRFPSGWVSDILLRGLENEMGLLMHLGLVMNCCINLLRDHGGGGGGENKRETNHVGAAASTFTALHRGKNLIAVRRNVAGSFSFLVLSLVIMQPCEKWQWTRAVVILTNRQNTFFLPFKLRPSPAPCTHSLSSSMSKCIPHRNSEGWDYVTLHTDELNAQRKVHLFNVHSKSTCSGCYTIVIVRLTADFFSSFNVYRLCLPGCSTVNAE